MPTLDEKQRDWLDAAIRNKGRFTTKNSIQKAFEEYRRRRAKVSTALEGMDPNHALFPTVQQHLTDADAFAETGKFENAYKSLAKIKGQAKNAAGAKLDAIATGNLQAALDDIRRGLNSVFPKADFAVSQFNTLIAKVNKLPAVGEAGTLEVAIKRRQHIADREPELIVEFNSCVGNCQSAIAAISQATPRQVIANTEAMVLNFEKAGLAKQIAAQKQLLADMKIECEEYQGRYATTDVLNAFLSNCESEVKKRLREVKDFKGFQKRSSDGDAPVDTPDASDVPTAQGFSPNMLQRAKAGLKALDPEEIKALEATEKLRLAAIQQRLVDDGLLDARVVQDKSMGPIRPSPEPGRFDPDDLFDGLPANGQAVPDNVPLDMAQGLIDEVAQKLRIVVTQMAPGSDELIDLFLKSEEDLARMANLALNGIDSPVGFTELQDQMLKQMAAAMTKAIADSSPNKVSADKSELTMGTDKWILVKTLGAGAGGTAMLYAKEGNPRETMVVKTPNPIDEENQPYSEAEWDKLSPEEKKDAEIRSRKAMSEEMRTHHRLSKDNQGNGKAENLLEMGGAAIGPEGELFMIMETAAGGDVADVSMNISAANSIGIIPPEARAALSQDLLIQTVKGMKALEQRGLIHNDLKPENILMTEDGTLKIMDFGESRFGDDQGQTESQRSVEGTDKAFRTTPGFDGDEQYEKDGKISSKSDVFAFGTMAKLLAPDDYSAGAIRSDMKGSSAMARLVKAAQSKKPEDRPSLDSLLASSVLSANEQDHGSDQVAELRKAMVKFSTVMSAAKTTVDPGMIPPAEPQKDNNAQKRADDIHVMARTLLEAQVQQLKKTEMKLSDLQFMAKSMEDGLKGLRHNVRIADLGNKELAETTVEAQIKAIAFIKTLMKDVAEQTASEGRVEYEKLLADKEKKLTVPGNGGGEMTVKAAVDKRDELIKEIKVLQDDFYDFANHFPENAASQLEAVNQTLTEKDGQIKAINASIYDLLGPKGKFMIAEKEVSEIGAKFVT